MNGWLVLAIVVVSIWVWYRIGIKLVVRASYWTSSPFDGGEADAAFATFFAMLWPVIFPAFYLWGANSPEKRRPVGFRTAAQKEVARVSAQMTGKVVEEPDRLGPWERRKTIRKLRKLDRAAGKLAS